MNPAPTIEPSFCADAFSLTPDPRRLFPSRGHAEALAGLRLGLQYRRGLIVVVGEVGTGKTTVAYSLLGMLGDEARTAYVANTRLPFVALLRQALEDFGVECAGLDLGGLLSALKTFLLECAQSGLMAVLVIDEAQGLDADTFEQLRLLSNVETYEHKLLQIVLLGQPELDARLREPQLRQIAERVAVRVNINPLDHAESRRYIEHRLLGSGGSLAMFSPAALWLIVHRARGIPRRMNILCHNALLLAFAAGASQVTWSMAREAIRDPTGGDLVRLRSSILDPAQWRVWAAGACVALTAGVMVGRGVPDAPRQDVGKGVVNMGAAGVPSRISDGEISAAAEGPAADDRAARLDASSEAAAAPLPAAVGDDPSAVAADTPSGVTAGAVPEDAPSVRSSFHRQVTVDRGTTLLRIARRFYGANDPALIRRIMQANPTISDPDFIVAGSKLVLPLVESPRDEPATRAAIREKRA